MIDLFEWAKMKRRKNEVTRFEQLYIPEPNSGCWLWLGATDSKGYGNFSAKRANGRRGQAHRWSYEHFICIVPDNLELDHLCRNKTCVNPWHLEPVTSKINSDRSPLHFKHKTHCPKGHEYTAENTYVKKGKRYLHRNCRACRKIARANRSKKRDISKLSLP